METKQYKATQCVKIDPTIGQQALASADWPVWAKAAAVSVQDWGYSTQERVIDEIERNWRLFNPTHKRSGNESIRRTAYHSFRWWITHSKVVTELGHI